MVVDKSLEANHGQVVIVIYNCKFTVIRFHRQYGCVYLTPENKEFESIEIQASDDFEIWGVATSVVRQL